MADTVVGLLRGPVTRAPITIFPDLVGRIPSDQLLRVGTEEDAEENSLRSCHRHEIRGALLHSLDEGHQQRVWPDCCRAQLHYCRNCQVVALLPDRIPQASDNDTVAVDNDHVIASRTLCTSPSNAELFVGCRDRCIRAGGICNDLSRGVVTLDW